jgi:hypothetical protein
VFTGTVDLLGEPTTVASGAAAPYHQCPGGEQLADFHRGDRVFAPGVDASGEWVEVRSPVDMAARVWVEARFVTGDGPLDDLPVTDCLVPVAISAAAESTTTSTTEAAGDTTTSSTTTETTTGTTAPPATGTTSPPATGTTAPPDSTGPSIAGAAANPVSIWEEDGLGITCPGGTARQATISATVTDPSGVATVTAGWSDPGGSQNVAMSASGGVYSTTLGPYAAGAWDPASTDPYDHVVNVTITARDGVGNESTAVVVVTVFEIGQCFG